MTTPATSAGSTVPDDLAAAIDRKIHEAVKFEEDRRFRQLKWLGLILGFVGTGTLSAIATLYVDGAIEARSGRLADQAALFRVQAMAAKFEGSTGFSNEEAESVVRILRRISESADSRQSPEVRLALTSVLEALVGAGEGNYVDEIVDLYTKELRQSGVATEMLIHHYGQEINSRAPGIRLAWQADSLKRFETFERLSRQRNVEELALAYRTLYEFIEGGAVRNARTDALVQRALALTQERDRTRFFHELLVRTQASNWVNSRTTEADEIQRRTRLLVAAYLDHFRRDADLQAALREVARRGCKKDACRELAQAMVEAYAPH